MSIDSGDTKVHSAYRPSNGASLSFADARSPKETSMSRPDPVTAKSWTQLQVCDAISCTPIGRAMPPHLGTAVGPALTPVSTASKRIPWSRWMNSGAKNHFVASLGEFTGTTMFLFLAFAGTEIVMVNSVPQANEIVKLLYISLCFGFSLMVNAWIFFRISGALFNPAVTLAMLIVGALGPLRALCLFLAQLAGSIAASAMVLGIFPQQLQVNTVLSSTTSHIRGLWIEAFLTAELIFTILMLAKEKHRSTFMAPVGIGLALFISAMVGVYYTGASLNPARTFGPAVVTNTWKPYHWIYWVGPIMGALMAVAFYKFIKLLEYEMANPGQDADMTHDSSSAGGQHLNEQHQHRSRHLLNRLGVNGLMYHHDHQRSDEEQALPEQTKEDISEPQTPVKAEDAASPIVKPQAVVGSLASTQRDETDP